MKRITALLIVLATLLCLCAGAESYNDYYNYDDRDTIIAMYGDESRLILAVKTALIEKGYLLPEEESELFDEYAEQAVMNFQYYKGYPVTGQLTKGQFYNLSRKYYMQWFDSSYIVWITEGGSRYHLETCFTIQGSYNVMPISVNKAAELGYQPCRFCNHWYY